MDPNQLPSFDPNSLAWGGPGFTPLPGSYLQLQSSGPQGQQPLRSNVGFNNAFDPVASNAFDQLMQDLNSKKRASPDQFPHDTNLQLYKRQILEAQQPGSMQAMLNTTLANMPSIPPCTTWPNQAPSTCAPLLPIFSHGSVQAANNPVLNSNFFNQSNLTHTSPYGHTALQQSPGPQQNLVVTEDAYHALQSRLEAALQTIDALKEKCSRFEKALRQYTTPDSKTGKLPIQLMKDEITNLRQICTQHENNVKKLEAKCEDYSKKYTWAARMYNDLSKEAREMYALYSSQMPTPPAPGASNTSASITSAAAPAAAPAANPVQQSVVNPVVNPVTQPGAQSIVPPVAEHVSQSIARSTAAPVASSRDNPIDLTTGDDSDSSAATVSSNGPSTAEPNNALTSFRRNLNQKGLKWLQPAHPTDATHDLYKQLKTRDKQGNAEPGLGDCNSIVQTQQHVRQALGGPFNQPPASPRAQPLAMPEPCNPTKPPEKKPAEVATDESQKESPMTDEELEEMARKMEEEFERDLDDKPTADDLDDKPTADGLAYLFEEDPANPIGDGLGEECSVSGGDPGPSDEFLMDLLTSYNQWHTEQQKAFEAGTISQEDFVKLIGTEWH